MNGYVEKDDLAVLLGSVLSVDEETGLTETETIDLFDHYHSSRGLNND